MGSSSEAQAVELASRLHSFVTAASNSRSSSQSTQASVLCGLDIEALLEFESQVSDLVRSLLGGSVPPVVWQPLTASFEQGYVPRPDRTDEEQSFQSFLLAALEATGRFLARLRAFADMQRPLEDLWGSVNRVNIFIRYWERCDALEHTDVKEPTRLPAEPQRPSKDSFQRTHSVFISYGQPDHAVAEKVNAALRRFGIKTFFFPENSPAGLKLHKLMRDGVNSHDRILLVCSEHSLNRKGVLNEIEETLQREARDGGATYLIPLMLDDFVLTRWSPPDPGMLTAVRDRVIADFRGADENEATFESAVRRLVEVLVFTDDRSEIGAAAEGTGHVPAEAILQDFEVGATNATDAGAQIHFREELGDAPEIFAHATKLYERGTRVMATHIVRSLAWRGFPPAQAMLGDLYQSGNSLQRDFERASRWYMLSAHRGNADAQFELAQLISSGKVRGGTEAHVERLYERAASQGHEGAEFCIAELAYRRAYYDQALKLLETIHSNTSHRYWCEAVSILRTMYWRGEGVEQNATYVRHLKYEGVMQGCWEGGTDG